MSDKKPKKPRSGRKKKSKTKDATILFKTPGEAPQKIVGPIESIEALQSFIDPSPSLGETNGVLTLSTVANKKITETPEQLGIFSSQEELGHLRHYNESTSTVLNKAQGATTILSTSGSKKEPTEPSLFVKSKPPNKDALRGSGQLRSSLGKSTKIVDDMHSKTTTTTTNELRFQNIMKDITATEDSSIGQKIKNTINSSMSFDNVDGVGLIAEKNQHIETITDWFDATSNPILESKSFLQKQQQKIHKAPPIEIISRKWSRDFFRAPDAQQGEKPCTFGKNCQSVQTFRDLVSNGYIKKTPEVKALLESPDSLIMREFISPKKWSDLVGFFKDSIQTDLESVTTTYENNELSMCKFCERYWVSTRSIEKGAAIESAPNICHQNYSEIFNMAGEYNNNARLICGDGYTGHLQPTVRFCFTDYIPVIYTVYTMYFENHPNIFLTMSEVENLESQFNPTLISKTTHRNIPGTLNGNTVLMDSVTRDTSNDSMVDVNSIPEPKRSEIRTNLVRRDINGSSNKFYNELANNKSSGKEILTTKKLFGWVESSQILFDSSDDATAFHSVTEISRRFSTPTKHT
jgi:hypothetical protein